MGRSTVHYADSTTNNTLKQLHRKLRPAGTPVQRVEYIIELLLLRIFEVKLKQDPDFTPLRKLFRGDQQDLLFSCLYSVPNEQILPTLNSRFFPFYAGILTKARKVISGNPSSKIQDQLVLIEEVFGNSNFSNNVTSGNMQEVIGLVGQLDEDRLLKTDLLGDAIESALSETGGTKDIGLHRTPDHIRQFMVGLVAPTFDDQLFDPTAGTGGFLFDGFEFVMESVTREGHWPGPKSHPELAAWFKDYFSRHRAKMPSAEKSTDFYRQGIMGIEYLGMIRKMAAINFYIRGLNPGNILQGDSLQKFKKEYFPDSKTAILANPPFGAERDQEAYPDVWAEYSRESETTILFVKLMLETLKPGGRCAVVVSEGFLTWDQNSARALRKSLLDDANLRAVFSLPQGVFVSKGGQGPKTSILYFEKGHRSEQVWFYKVSNDGYTLGTNRKQVAGCQLVEALDLFHRHVRKGQIPPESRHSFTIPVAWIKTLDPRVKERIREDTTAELTAKSEEERGKLLDALNARQEAGKVTAADIEERLMQHNQLWQAKTQNEIARRIERAHLFSFNLANYRSTLTPAQCEAWQRAASSASEATNGNLDTRYEQLKTATPQQLASALTKLNPTSSLELELARQALATVSQDAIVLHPKLGKLAEILAAGSKIPRVPLMDLLKLVREKAEIDPETLYRLVTVRLYGKGVHLRSETPGENLKGNNWFRVKRGDLILSKIDARNGAFGIIPNDLHGAIVTPEFPTFEPNASDCDPSFLNYLLSSPQFYSQIDAMVSGASGRRRVQVEDFLQLQVPLPPIEAQTDLAAELRRQQSILDGANLLSDAWRIDLRGYENRYTKIPLGQLIETSLYGTSDKSDYAEIGTPVLRIGNIGFCEFALDDLKRVELTEKEQAKYELKDGDFLIVRSNGNPDLVGKCAVWPGGQGQFAYASYLIRFRFKSDVVLPRYVMYYLMSDHGRSLLSPQQGGGTYNISATTFQTVKLAVPPIDEQRALVSLLDQELATVRLVKQMAETAKASASALLQRLWEN